MPKHKHPNRDHMPYKHLHLLDTAYYPPISQALPARHTALGGGPGLPDTLGKASAVRLTA